MTYRTELEGWDVEEIRNIEGLEFSAALKFNAENRGRKKDSYIFPLASDTTHNEIWQVGDGEFVIYNNPELYHILILPNATGIQTLHRTSAKNPQSFFDGTLFRFENFSGAGNLYSVVNRKEIGDIVRCITHPDVETTVELGTEVPTITVRAPYFKRYLPLSQAKDYADSISEALANDLDEFEKRCEEAKIAEYYEKCGGYHIDNSPAMVVGCFTEEDGRYEYRPDDFFKNIATKYLLAANNLSPGLPADPCVFWKKAVDDDDCLIEPSHDVLLINNKISGKKYGLEMYGERCVGVMRAGENDFLALLEPDLTHSPTKFRRFVHLTSGKYVWDNGNFWWDHGASTFPANAVLRPDRCQLDDDTIVFTSDEDYNTNSSFEMWSISKNRRVNPVDSFDALKKATNDPYVCHMERQIMVKYRNHPQWKAWPMIVVRIYSPKQYCDIFALVEPNKRYRIYGKVYNMMADSMVEGPKTVHGLVKMFEENRALKLKYSL